MRILQAELGAERISHLCSVNGAGSDAILDHLNNTLLGKAVAETAGDGGCESGDLSDGELL